MQFTYLAKTGPLHFWNQEDISTAHNLVNAYNAALTIDDFERQALFHLRALAKERGEAYPNLPVHRVYVDLRRNIRVKLGKEEGLVSLMLNR